MHCALHPGLSVNTTAAGCVTDGGPRKCFGFFLRIFFFYPYSLVSDTMSFGGGIDSDLRYGDSAPKPRPSTEQREETVPVEG